MANENNADDKPSDGGAVKAEGSGASERPAAKVDSIPPKSEPAKPKVSEPPVPKTSEPPAAKVSEPPTAKISEPPAAKPVEAAAEEMAEAKAPASEPRPEPKKEAVTKENGITTRADKPKKKKSRPDEHAVAPVATREATHAPPTDTHGHGTAGQHVNRREYIVMFFILAALTALEVGIVKIPGVDKLLIRIGLVSLALTKAACVGLYYMHLKHETKIMRVTVMVPFAAPALYALVLISEAAWRLIRW